jgi:hypothetical protein
MKSKLMFSNLLLLVLLLALAPEALASSTWYVDGLNGSDSVGCFVGEPSYSGESSVESFPPRAADSPGKCGSG